MLITILIISLYFVNNIYCDSFFTLNKANRMQIENKTKTEINVLVLIVFTLIVGLSVLAFLTRLGLNTVIRRSSEIPIRGNQRKIHEILQHDVPLLS